jgi:hypothetical protein
VGDERDILGGEVLGRMADMDRAKHFVDDPDWTTDRALALLAEVRRLRGERVGYEEALHGAAGANDELRREVEAARLEAERHRREIERMAEERHLLHSSPGREDRFWNCSRGPCKAASQYLRGNGDGGAAC